MLFSRWLFVNSILLFFFSIASIRFPLSTACAVSVPIPAMRGCPHVNLYPRRLLHPLRLESSPLVSQWLAPTDDAEVSSTSHHPTFSTTTQRSLRHKMSGLTVPDSNLVLDFASSSRAHVAAASPSLDSLVCHPHHHHALRKPPTCYLSV